MQSDWLKAFWTISQEQDFFQTQDLCSNTANNEHIHYRTNLLKINEQFFL